MSDEASRTPAAIELIRSAHVQALSELQQAQSQRQMQQLLVEERRAKADELGDFLAQQEEEPEEGTEFMEKRARQYEETHALKFRGLIAPASVYPARGLTLTITHPTIGDGFFVFELTPALKEFADYQEMVEGPGVSDIRGPRYPFTASNGVVFDVQAHVQTNPPPPPPRDPAEPAQLVPATFRHVDFE